MEGVDSFPGERERGKGEVRTSESTRESAGPFLQTAVGIRAEGRKIQCVRTVCRIAFFPRQLGGVGVSYSLRENSKQTLSDFAEAC